MHNGSHFLLYRDFNGAILPFGYRSQSLTLFIDNRIGVPTIDRPPRFILAV
jgi:hypothetical protein